MPDRHAQVAKTVAGVFDVLSYLVPPAKAGADVIKSIEKMRESKATREKLATLLASAEAEFIREQGQGVVANYVLQMPQQNRPAFQQALKAMLENWREEDLQAVLSREFRGLPGVTEKDQQRAVVLYIVTLRRYLVQDPEFNPLITAMSQLRTEELVEEQSRLIQRILRALINLDILGWPVQPLPLDGGELHAFLLHPKYRLIPYTGPAYQEVLEELLAWAHDPGAGSSPYGVRVYTGAGGSGKTRLLIEAGEVLRAENWRVGFLVGQLNEHSAADLLADTRPTLLILDYIDSRKVETELLLRKLAEQHKNGGRAAPLVVVLIERSLPDWLKETLRSASDPQQVNWPEFLALPGVQKEAQTVPALDGGGREALFKQALRQFAALRKVPVQEAITYTESELPQSPLLVALLALHAAQGRRVDNPANEEAVLRYTWARERDFWKRRLVSRIADSSYIHPIQDLIEDLTVIGTLGKRFTNPVGLGSFIGANFEPLRTLQGPMDTTWLAKEINRLFPQGLGITPDPLADYVLREQLKDQPELIDRALPTPMEAAETPAESAEAVWTALTALQRLRRAGASPAEYAQTQAWVDRVTHALEGWPPESAPGGRVFWSILDARIPFRTQMLRRLAVAVTKARLAGTPPEDEVELARLTNNLGKCLSESGQREEALEVAREAVELYRKLAAGQPAAFEPYLAGSLNNLAMSLSALGERGEALEVAREAVELYRKLAAGQPAAFEPDLAMSLNTLATFLSELGQRAEALAVGGEAVELYRKLAAGQPAAFEPDLAMSLNTLATFLSELGQREEALEVAREAVELYRKLAAGQPAAFEPYLAMSLNNLAAFLSALGERGEALEVAREAVKVYRKLAAGQPAAFEPDLAMSLNNLGNRLSESGQRAEALAAGREAVEIRRKLAAGQPAAFEPYLAGSLNNLATFLSELGQREEALEVAREAVELYRKLAAGQPAAFEPYLAVSLNNLAMFLSELGQRAEALDPAREAVGLYRKLAAGQPAAFEPDLANSLDTLAEMLGGVEDYSGGIAASEESIRLLGPYFLGQPAAFREWMDGFLKTYRDLCARAGRPVDHALIDPLQAKLDELEG